MAGILLDASKNKEFAEAHPEAVKALSEDEEGSAAGRRRQGIEDVYIPPDEEEELLRMFGTAVVQDFEDEFHMSKEERAKMQERYEKFFRLRKNFTRKIRSLTKYVEAFRLCMEIVDEIAQTNGIYDPDTFRKKVMNGQITINGLNFPKFQGKKKKSINWEYVAEFIDDPTMDIRELTETKEVAEEKVTIDPETTISQDEMEYILSEPDKKQVSAEEYAALVGDDMKSVATNMGKKRLKWLIKHCPGYTGSLKEMKKISGQNARRRANVWDLEDSELEVLKAYDAKVRGESLLKMPVFKGNIADSDQVNSYLFQMDEYLDETTFVEYNGRMITVAEKEEIDYMRLLEENGWDLKNIYGNRERQKRIKKADKEDKRRLEALRKMLSMTQKRTDLREQGYSEKQIDKMIEEEEKKKGKGKKKKKKLGKKVDKKSEAILMDVLNRDEEDFKSYKRAMERM